MRTLLVFFCLSSIIFFSKCETVQDPEEEETTVADTCTKEDDDENLTKENCFTRTAKSSELECCYLTYKIEKIEDSMCVSALKSKTKEIEVVHSFHQRRKFNSNSILFYLCVLYPVENLFLILVKSLCFS